MSAATALLMHMLNIAHGITAALVCAAGLYIVGSALVPRRWDDTVGRGESPAVLGAALYVLACWFGVMNGVPVVRLAMIFGGVALMLAVVRYRWLTRAFKARGVFTRGTIGWLLTFLLLYVLAYVFTMPPASDDYLPLAWTGNIDLLTYVRYTKYLMRLGPSNLAGFSYLGDVYLQTPAVFYLLGGLSEFFGQEPLRAAMSAQFALVALIGVVSGRMARSVFRLSNGAALAIACIVVGGPFFRYIVGAYYLSTLMSMPILLYLVWMTISNGSQGSQGSHGSGASRKFLGFLDVGLAVRFAGAYILLLFLYPFLLLAALAAQAAVIGLRFVADFQATDLHRSAWREAVEHAGLTIGAAVVPLGLLVLGLFQRFAWSWYMVRSLSTPGIAGWPLDLISPLAVLGLPGTIADHARCRTCYGIEVAGPGMRLGAIALFSALALGFGYLYFWRFRHRTTPAQRTLVGLACGSFVAYCAYFLRVGPSYQQWKLASYVALPWSFALVAGGVHLLQRPDVSGRPHVANGPSKVMAFLTAVAVSIVGGNLLLHAFSDPRLVRFPGAMRNIAQVDQLPFFRELTVQMDDSRDDFPTWLALYYLPSKRVHVVSPRFKPSEPLSFEQISRARPLLLQGFGCEGIGHGETLDVPDVGCLLFAPPSPVPDTPYPFNRTFLFVGLEGFSARQPEGRWNAGSSVRVTLTVDLKRVWAYDDMYVNLLVNPYLPPGTARQRLGLSWGANRRAEVSLAAPQRISLLVQRPDWTGDRVWTLPISIELPDAVEPVWMYAPRGSLDGLGALGALFEEISISSKPGGIAVTNVSGGP